MEELLLMLLLTANRGFELETSLSEKKSAGYFFCKAVHITSFRAQALLGFSWRIGIFCKRFFF